MRRPEPQGPNLSARSLVTAATPAAGVRPEIPVAAGSPPKRRAAAKSTSSSWARGCVPPPRPACTTAAGVEVIDNTPSTEGAENPRNRSATVGPPGSGTATISSTGPSWSYAAARIDRLMVSPTMSEPVMIAVPSSEPTMTSSASTGRPNAWRVERRRINGDRARITANGIDNTTSRISDTTVSRSRRSRRACCCR